MIQYVKILVVTFTEFETFCVSIEKCEGEGHHLHTYLFYDSKSCVEVSDYIGVFHDSTVSVQICKTARNWLKYITKEDDSPYFSCEVSKLSFSYRAKRWCKNTSAFSFRDSFVVEHHNKWKFLQNMHNETISHISELCGVYSIIEKKWNNWCYDVCRWWTRREGL